MNQFVIIGGSPRSGTNLARRIVGSHSQIAIPPGELQFFNQLADGKSVEEILRNPRLKKWGIELASHCDCAPAQTFVRVLESYARKMHKTIPGEKTPTCEFSYSEIKDALRDYDLKFIHMVRNPFDVMASYKHMQAMRGSAELNSIRELINTWVASVSLAIERTKNDPDHYMFVRYEDMAGNPVAAAASLCEFIGVECEKDRMLGLSDFAGHRDNTSFATDTGAGHEFHDSIKAPISRKSYLSEKEVRKIAIACGAVAMEAGYSDPQFTAYPKRGLIRNWFSSLITS
jgi:Sulfotransferase family